MKFIGILIVLGVVAFLATNQTQTQQQTQQKIVDQAEAISDCQNEAIAAGNDSATTEGEIAASQKALSDCLARGMAGQSGGN